MTNQIFSSVRDHYENSGYAQFPQEYRVVGSVPTEFLKADQSAHDFVDPPIPQLMITLSLASDIPFRWDLGDGFSKEKRYRTGSLNLCPPDTEVAYDCGGDHNILILAMARDEVAEMLDEEKNGDFLIFGPLYEQAVFSDDFIRHAALKMWSESLNGDRASLLQIDGLFQSILGRLLRLSGVAPRTEHHRLPQATLARVDEYIDARCDIGLKTADLAELTNLTWFQFSRQFKRTTGRTPHAYVLERRIARACDLLAESGQSLADIAYACGFSSQAHMTTTFRKKLGVTPGQYRNDILK